MLSKNQATKEHYISSILPYDYKINKPTQFIKNRQFYRPEQFIWNNPHRTSNKMYPYYHKANEQYKLKVKPLIQRLEEEDRKGAETERILRLTKIRQQTRSKFFNRRKQREDLEEKSHEKGRNKEYVTLERLRRKSEKAMSIFKTDYETPVSGRLYLDTIKARVSTMTLEKGEDSFAQGIEAYDKNLNQIKQLIQHELDLKRDKIRQVFQKRKQKNEQFRIPKKSAQKLPYA